MRDQEYLLGKGGNVEGNGVEWCIFGSGAFWFVQPIKKEYKTSARFTKFSLSGDEQKGTVSKHYDQLGYQNSSVNRKWKLKNSAHETVSGPN